MILPPTRSTLFPYPPLLRRVETCTVSFRRPVSRPTSSAQYGHTLQPSLSCLLQRGHSLLNCVLQCGHSTYWESIGSPQLGHGRSSRIGPPGSDNACVSSSSARRSAIVSGGRTIM